MVRLRPRQSACVWQPRGRDRRHEAVVASSAAESRSLAAGLLRQESKLACSARQSKGRRRGRRCGAAAVSESCMSESSLSPRQRGHNGEAASLCPFAPLESFLVANSASGGVASAGPPGRPPGAGGPSHGLRLRGSLVAATVTVSHSRSCHCHGHGVVTAWSRARSRTGHAK